MTAAIRTENLTKYYGSHPGLIDLDLEVRAGEVFGFLGPNGAGKTTTMRLLLDLIRPTRGHAEVLGLDPRAAAVQVHRRIGYLPGELALEERLTARQLFEFYGHLRGGVDTRLVASLAERLELDVTRPIGNLSRGNKQKAGLVQAFMHRPELLILDEPTSGLDPLVQQEFLRMVAEARDQGQTVFLSSHVITEVQHVADRAGIIRGGRLVAIEDVDALKAKALRRVEIQFGAPVPAAPFQHLPGVRDLRLDGARLDCTVEGGMDPLVKAAAGFTVVSMLSREPDLEEIFLTYYTEPGNHAAQPVHQGTA